MTALRPGDAAVTASGLPNCGDIPGVHRWKGTSDSVSRDHQIMPGLTATAAVTDRHGRTVGAWFRRISACIRIDSGTTSFFEGLERSDRTPTPFDQRAASMRL